MERSPKTLVVDASVVTKWFVEELDSDNANLLKKAQETSQMQLTAPDLLVYEVTNALGYHPKMTVDDVVQSTRRLLELELDLVPPSAELAAETARTAKRHAISAYDASYVALADMIGSNCVTSDGKLYKKMLGKKRLFFLSSLGKEWTIPGSA